MANGSHCRIFSEQVFSCDIERNNFDFCRLLGSASIKFFLLVPLLPPLSVLAFDDAVDVDDDELLDMSFDLIDFLI